MTNRITPARTPPAPAAAAPAPAAAHARPKPAPGRLRGAHFAAGRGIAPSTAPSTGRPKPRGQASGKRRLKQVAHAPAHGASGHAHAHAAAHGHAQAHPHAQEHANRHATDHGGGHGGGHGGDAESEDDAEGRGQGGHPQHGGEGGGGRGGARGSLHAAPFGPSGPPAWLTDACSGMGGLDRIPAAYAHRLVELVRTSPAGVGPAIRKSWLADTADVLRFTHGQPAGEGGLAEVRERLMAATRDRAGAAEPSAMQKGLNLLLPLMLLNMQRGRTPGQLDAALSRLAVMARQAAEPAVSLRLSPGEE